MHVLLSGLMGPHVDVEAGPPVFVREGIWLGAVRAVSPNVAAPHWHQYPDGVPHGPDLLQERPAEPFGGVFSMWGEGSEASFLLIWCSWSRQGVTVCGHVQRVLGNGHGLDERGIPHELRGD